MTTNFLTPKQRVDKFEKKKIQKVFDDVRQL